MQNGLLYPAVLMGAFRGGYVAVPINAKLHPREVGYIVENAAAKAIVVDSDALEGVAAAAPSLRSEDFIVAGTPSAPGNLDALLRRKTANGGPPAECNPSDPAWLFYTSGRTGRPKGAMVSHRNLIAMAVNFASFKKPKRIEFLPELPKNAYGKVLRLRLLGVAMVLTEPLLD